MEVLATGYPMAYVRGGTLAVVLNPGRSAVRLPLDGVAGATQVVAKGCRVEAGDGGHDVVHLDGHGYAVLDLAGVAADDLAVERDRSTIRDVDLDELV